MTTRALPSGRSPSKADKSAGRGKWEPSVPGSRRGDWREVMEAWKVGERGRSYVTLGSHTVHKLRAVLRTGTEGWGSGWSREGRIVSELLVSLFVALSISTTKFFLQASSPLFQKCGSIETSRDTYFTFQSTSLFLLWLHDKNYVFHVIGGEKKMTVPITEIKSLQADIRQVPSGISLRTRQPHVINTTDWQTKVITLWHAGIVHTVMFLEITKTNIYNNSWSLYLVIVTYESITLFVILSSLLSYVYANGCNFVWMSSRVLICKRFGVVCSSCMWHYDRKQNTPYPFLFSYFGEHPPNSRFNGGQKIKPARQTGLA